jgi:hypothetical protein
MGYVEGATGAHQREEEVPRGRQKIAWSAECGKRRGVVVVVRLLSGLGVAAAQRCKGADLGKVRDRLGLGWCWGWEDGRRDPGLRNTTTTFTIIAHCLRQASVAVLYSIIALPAGSVRPPSVRARHRGSLPLLSLDVTAPKRIFGTYIRPTQQSQLLQDSLPCRSSASIRTSPVTAVMHRTRPASASTMLLRDSPVEGQAMMICTLCAEIFTTRAHVCTELISRKPMMVTEIRSMTLTMPSTTTPLAARSSSSRSTSISTLRARPPRSPTSCRKSRCCTRLVKAPPSSTGRQSHRPRSPTGPVMRATKTPNIFLNWRRVPISGASSPSSRRSRLRKASMSPSRPSTPRRQPRLGS